MRRTRKPLTGRILARVPAFVLIAAGPLYAAPAKQTVTIEIDAGRTVGEMVPMWAYFGYDEANYTYLANGRKLLGELAALSPVPVHVRAHNLLNTDDGPRVALKWGSTNAYTQDAAGKAVYDWTIVDRIFDTWVENGMQPLVEIGFMPRALSTKPDPYRHHWAPGAQYNDIFTGWAQPPTDYARWAELVFRWVRHSVERYGERTAATWSWEVWNEPNIGYWQGTQEEYFKLYDYTADAVKRALPTARIGGPTTTGPRWDQAADWLRAFLEHCAAGTNYATGKQGAPLDFISYHAKGAPKDVDGHVRMDMGAELGDIATGFAIVADSAFPKLPIVIGEADPEGCAACSFASGYKGNGYRNGLMYASYTASSFAKMYELADSYGVNLEGALSWSFQFEDQPWFDGFRSLATNGVDKPVLNVFRMFGMMRGARVAVRVDEPVTAAVVLEHGVRGARPDVDALASRTDHELAVLVWNYHDDDVPAADAPVVLRLHGLPSGRALLEHYRIDATHSNAYAVWKNMGRPQQVMPADYARLERAGKLELLDAPEWIRVADSGASITFPLPRQAVSLLRLSW
jgi:xylan 1,4-beta-xylosidase